MSPEHNPILALQGGPVSDHDKRVDYSIITTQNEHTANMALGGTGHQHYVACDNTACILESEVLRLRAENERHKQRAEVVEIEMLGHIKKLMDAIRDIDHHSTPLGEDEDGFVTAGYLVSVGAMHRALGLVIRLGSGYPSAAVAGDA